MTDTNFGLESFEEFAARHRDVRRDVLRGRYDKAAEEKKQEQIRENAAARQRRLDAEAKTKREAEAKREAEDAKSRESALAAMKQKARAFSTASGEDFERLWPQLRDQMLIDETREREAAARESMRQQYAGNF